MAQHNYSLICWTLSSSLALLESEGLAQGHGSCIEEKGLLLSWVYSPPYSSGYKRIVTV